MQRGNDINEFAKETDAEQFGKVQKDMPSASSGPAGQRKQPEQHPQQQRGVDAGAAASGAWAPHYHVGEGADREYHGQATYVAGGCQEHEGKYRPSDNRT
jgi:hypothetical protein